MGAHHLLRFDLPSDARCLSDQIRCLSDQIRWESALSPSQAPICPPMSAVPLQQLARNSWATCNTQTTNQPINQPTKQTKATNPDSVPQQYQHILFPPCKSFQSTKFLYHRTVECLLTDALGWRSWPASFPQERGGQLKGCSQADQVIRSNWEGGERG